MDDFSRTGDEQKSEHRAPGEYRAKWTLRPGRAGRLRLVAKIVDSAAPSAIAQIAVDAGSAAAVDLTADREIVSAGSGAELILRARQRDSMGNPTTEPLELTGIDGFGTFTPIRLSVGRSGSPRARSPRSAWSARS